MLPSNARVPGEGLWEMQVNIPDSLALAHIPTVIDLHYFCNLGAPIVTKSFFYGVSLQLLLIYLFIHPLIWQIFAENLLPARQCSTHEKYKENRLLKHSVVSIKRQMYKNNDNQYIITVPETLGQQSGG